MSIMSVCGSNVKAYIKVLQTNILPKISKGPSVGTET